jgi:hypothetical protein
MNSPLPKPQLVRSTATEIAKLGIRFPICGETISEFQTFQLLPGFLPSSHISFLLNWSTMDNQNDRPRHNVQRLM